MQIKALGGAAWNPPGQWKYGCARGDIPGNGHPMTIVAYFRGDTGSVEGATEAFSDNGLHLSGEYFLTSRFEFPLLKTSLELESGGLILGMTLDET